MRTEKFLNLNIKQPGELPAQSGIVFMVNRHGEFTTNTATRDASYRTRKSKMDKYYKEALDGNRLWFENTTSNCPENIDMYIKYPESIYRLVYWPMPFELADAIATKIRDKDLIARSQKEKAILEIA